MNKKGFTMIELLGAITLLALIALLVIPGIVKLIERSKNSMYESQKQTIKDALKTWGDSNTEILPMCVRYNATLTLTLGELKSYGFLDYDIKNPKNGKCISDDLELTIRRVEQTYVYYIEGDELIDDPSGECNNQKDLPVITLVGKNIVYMAEDSDYEDLGYSAKTIAGASVPVDTEFYNIEGDIVSSTGLSEGIYVVKYYATEDSKTAYAYRRVIVGRGGKSYCEE